MSSISMNRQEVYYVPSRPVRPSAKAPMQLTRRGRIALGTVIVLPLIAVAYLLGLGASQAGADSTSSTATFETVTVMPGDSLWTIATEIAPSADPQEVVASIVELNQLESATVQPGQQIAIPAEFSN